MGFRAIDLKRFAIKNGCVSGIDEKRNTREIDVPLLNRKLKRHIRSIKSRKSSRPDSPDSKGSVDFQDSPTFIEGHLSHLMGFADIVVILRCTPSILAKRLRRKGWRRAKIAENLQAEALGIITFEALELGKGGKGDAGRDLYRNSVFELDSTDAPPEALASAVLDIVSGKGAKWRAGRISWSKDVTEHEKELGLLLE